MKSFAVIAIAAFATAVSAAPCDLNELAADLISLAPQANACSEATQFPIIPPQTNPTAKQASDICALCGDLIAVANTKTFPSCTFDIDGVATPLNEFIKKVVGGCGSSSTAAGSSSAAGSSDVSAPAVETPAPAASTSSEAGSAASGSVGASGSVSTPAATTAAPSSAVTVSVSAAAVVVGSIAAFAL